MFPVSRKHLGAMEGVQRLPLPAAAGPQGNPRRSPVTRRGTAGSEAGTACAIFALKFSLRIPDVPFQIYIGKRYVCMFAWTRSLRMDITI